MSFVFSLALDLRNRFCHQADMEKQHLGAAHIELMLYVVGDVISCKAVKKWWFR